MGPQVAKFLLALGLLCVAAGCNVATTMKGRTLLKEAVPAEHNVRFVYVISHDGVDRRLDQGMELRNSILRLQRWLTSHADGRRFRIVSGSDGSPEILFARLSKSDADLISHGVRIRDEIEGLLTESEQLRNGELYLLYYDGAGVDSCGNSAWPPQLIGRVAIKYLHGFRNHPDCAVPTDDVDSDMTRFEFSTIHEIFHLLGAVPACAPHVVRGGHVGDDSRDIMYAGAERWLPSEIDVGRDDYFGHSNLRCLDIAASPYFERPTR